MDKNCHIGAHRPGSGTTLSVMLSVSISHAQRAGCLAQRKSRPQRWPVEIAYDLVEVLGARPFHRDIMRLHEGKFIESSRNRHSFTAVGDLRKVHRTMRQPPLRILSVSAEVAPYSKTGGLESDVASALPKALHQPTMKRPIR